MRFRYSRCYRGTGRESLYGPETQWVILWFEKLIVEEPAFKELENQA
jgi:hypothetical protein